MAGSIAAKSSLANRLEGMLLSAMLQGLPTFAGAALLLKLWGTDAIVGTPGGAALFVLLACLFHALLVPWLGPRFPALVSSQYEPLFFDATLSFSDKVARWRGMPQSSVLLMSNMIMLSVLAVAVASVR